MARLSFYVVDGEYCDYLRKSDPCVPYNTDKKANRPFVGILLEVDDMHYYAPLSSPKAKHLAMKNQVDFIKIEEGKYGVINLNNMIPIHINSLTAVNLVVRPADSEEEANYKALLSNQLTWCNAHRGEILSKAHRLYNIVTSGRAYPSLAARCCDFSLDEKNLRLYCAARGWGI